MVCAEQTCVLRPGEWSAQLGATLRLALPPLGRASQPLVRPPQQARHGGVVVHGRAVPLRLVQEGLRGLGQVRKACSRAPGLRLRASLDPRTQNAAGLGVRQVTRRRLCKGRTLLAPLQLCSGACGANAVQAVPNSACSAAHPPAGRACCPGQPRPLTGPAAAPESAPWQGGRLRSWTQPWPSRQAAGTHLLRLWDS